GYVSYGVVLHNVSPDEDAMSVSLTLNFLDANGLIVQSKTVGSVGPIPAGSTYYWGGRDFTSETAAPLVRLDVVSIAVSREQPKAIGDLPPVANIHFADGTSTHSDVLGQFTNPYTKTISSDASVTAVCFDAAGNVIGGGNGNPNADVTPGGSTGF